MDIERKDIEIMAPAGSYESLMAAIQEELILFISVLNILICGQDLQKIFQ